MSWLVVTPARNESERLPKLAASLARQTSSLVGLWVVVDDGSDDETSTAVDPAALPFPFLCLRRDNTGGLLTGSEFAAFFLGAERGLEELPDAERVMKLDADLELDPGYFAALESVPADIGLVGGIIDSPGEREQLHTVRGALKAFNRPAWEVVRRLPPVLGLDVLDEVALRQHGLDVLVVPEATATTSRRTGTSEGNALVGRRRNGVMCAWSGYHRGYFLLRCLRTLFRRPWVLGTVAMIRGYVTAGPSPFDVELRHALRDEQAERLRHLVRNPIGFVRRAYGLRR